MDTHIERKTFVEPSYKPKVECDWLYILCSILIKINIKKKNRRVLLVSYSKQNTE